jgi:hypothetical protein
MSTMSKRVDARLLAATALAGAGMAVSGQEAQAAIVYSGVVNLSVPRTTAGLYLNVVTGVNNTVPALAPGWDINPWWTGTSTGFFNPTPGPAGGSYVTVGGQTGNLAFGSPIGAASTYGSGSSAANWPVGATGLIGFRFINEANGNQVHYGWARINSHPAGGGTATIVDYAYDNVAGTSIGAGVPAPGSLALLALGAVGLTSRRRR